MFLRKFARRLRALNVPYQLIQGPDAELSPGAEGIALLQTRAWPRDFLSGSGVATFGTIEATSAGILALSPIGNPVTLGENTLEGNTYPVGQAEVGPWAG